MNWFVDLPIAVRLLLLLPVGAVAGAAINWATYTRAYFKRSISPWSSPPDDAPPRVWSDRLPIIGWWGLRRETAIHGSRFWIRPMAIEIGFTLAIAALYWWDVASQAYLSNPIRTGQLLLDLPFVPDLCAAEHMRFLAHAVLLLFMAVATLIDIDEKTIPDSISVTGTLIGLILVVILPWSLLFHVVRVPALPGLPANGVVIDGLFANVVSTLTFASPNVPSANMGSTEALAIGLACFLAWCFARLDRRWAGRLSWSKAVWLFVARATYGWFFWSRALIAAVGSLGIAMTWHAGGPPWRGLLTALIGMAVGGGIVWLVRIIGRIALKKEAMGFGDVTLMAMIGAFMGWQACLFIFFIAPFAGLVIGILQFALKRDDEIPYGPFLCLATLVVLFRWNSIWKSMAQYFEMPLLIPSVMAVCMAMMLVMLTVYFFIKRFIKRRLGFA